MAPPATLAEDSCGFSCVVNPAWRVGGNSRWPRGPAFSRLLLLLSPAAVTAAVAAAGHLGACGAAWLPLRRPLGVRGGGGEERDIHSNTGCAGLRAGASAVGGSPRALAAGGARHSASPARRARARGALALTVRLSGKSSRELSRHLPPAPATHPG